MHLRQPGFTYRGCQPFTKKTKKEYKIKQETGDTLYIYENELDKSSFQHTWFMEILKILLERQLLKKYCVIKHLILLKIHNMMDIKEVLL